MEYHCGDIVMFTEPPFVGNLTGEIVRLHPLGVQNAVVIQVSTAPLSGKYVAVFGDNIYSDISAM